MPTTERPTPDDERAQSPVLYVIFGLASMVLIALAVGVLVLPPLFMASAIRHGHNAVAVAIAIGYALVIAFAATRLFRHRKNAD